MNARRLQLTRRRALCLAGVSVLAQAIASRAQSGPRIVVYKDPKCGCCAKWITHLEQAGFTAEVVETADVASIKQNMAVPQDLGSCHTAKVDGYAIEGHVPASAILRLIADRPEVTGLAVPAMPSGSPGMEGGTPEIYEVILFGPKGRSSYGRYRGTHLL